MATSPSCRAAYRFNEEFVPVDELNYDWLTRYAEQKYEMVMKTCRALDDKASAVINYLGGAAGLVAAGAVAMAASSRLHLWVVAAFLLPALSAAVAVGFAAHARRPRDVYHPPGIDAAVRTAHHDFSHGGKGGASAFLGRWHLTVELMEHVAACKARWVGAATWGLVAAVAGLLLPLAVLVGRLAVGCAITYPPPS